MMKATLHDQQGLRVAVVLEDDTASVELESSEEGPDLSDADEVVVVVNGRACEVEVDSARRARAIIAAELSAPPEALTLMVRVHEFFEGWELFAEEERG